MVLSRWLEMVNWYKTESIVVLMVRLWRSSMLSVHILTYHRVPSQEQVKVMYLALYEYVLSSFVVHPWLTSFCHYFLASSAVSTAILSACDISHFHRKKSHHSPLYMCFRAFKSIIFSNSLSYSELLSSFHPFSSSRPFSLSDPFFCSPISPPLMTPTLH
ncbi:hypothetical protein K432DRAFT_12946 [Lepidopterella palustris CBS 459.81]|uniref:Uncharacterized protein n=1 Tax=Lepidopterella palustris CBS 459.81 TaxID=1314670 RepID=A0A8E2JKF8_9PEZI|nr:hypothetical protein K432DRAFT_12946 [Lepidopterella palustris CBS 459.81]